MLEKEKFHYGNRITIVETSGERGVLRLEREGDRYFCDVSHLSDGSLGVFTLK